MSFPEPPLQCPLSIPLPVYTPTIVRFVYCAFAFAACPTVHTGKSTEITYICIQYIFLYIFVYFSFNYFALSKLKQSRAEASSSGNCDRIALKTRFDYSFEYTHMATLMNSTSFGRLFMHIYSFVYGYRHDCVPGALLPNKRHPSNESAIFVRPIIIRVCSDDRRP